MGFLFKEALGIFLILIYFLSVTVAGGRSRLHLFDLGSCDKITSKPRDGGCLSLSALGNVILALFNGQKHVPYK